MALKQFVIPLDDKSIQTGDTNFKALVDGGQPVTFKLTNVSGGLNDTLNLITNKNGSQVNHSFAATVSGGSASLALSATQMSSVYNDAAGDEWDYVEANWTLGQVDTPDKSNQYELQSGHVYDTHGFPPKVQ